MATSDFAASQEATTRGGQPSSAVSHGINDVLGPLASLRLTVGLFTAAVLLVLFGTLAQAFYNVWHVVRETHFYTWFAWIEWRCIGRLMEMLIGGEWDGVDAKGNLINVPVPDKNGSTVEVQHPGFWFPGGQLIGSLMMINLAAAHAVRFKVTARGVQLFAGLIVIMLGIAAVAAVVDSGSAEQITSDMPVGMASLLWRFVQGSVGVAALGGCYWLVSVWGKIRTPEWCLAAAVVSLVVVGAGWLLFNPEIPLPDSDMRILWHLVQGTLAGSILLGGCYLAFGKRAGMVVIHGGIGLLMVGEMLTGLTAQEARMRIEEGQTVNYARDLRTAELAFTDRSDPNQERVTVVPQRYLSQPGELIQHPELPVDLKVLAFYANSRLFAPSQTDNLATAGRGLMVAAKPAPLANGIDSEINVPAAYVEIFDKTTGESTGVYLAAFIEEQLLEVGGKTYSFMLRFKRDYKPYSVKLHDFQTEYYPGTKVPKDFRAIVQLIDPANSVDRRAEIWMNNPLRYNGDMLYQASFTSPTTTELQVVGNSGWLIPYLSCQIVLVGLLAHFLLSLQNFLRRRAEEGRREVMRLGGESPGIDWGSPYVLGPILVGVLWAGYLASRAQPVIDAPGEMKIAEFAALPVADGGRIKPYDTLARNTLQMLSGRQTVKYRERKIPAIEWMLDLLTQKEEVFRYRVFRIENLEVLNLLGLERRPGSFRYSYEEVTAGENDKLIGEQLDLIRDVDPDNYGIFQSKIAELGSKLNVFRGLSSTFVSMSISGDPDRVVEDVFLATMRAVKFGDSRVPRAVCPANLDGEWLSLYEAELIDLVTSYPRIKEIVRGVFERAPVALPKFEAMIDRFEQAGDSGMSRTLRVALDAYYEGDVEGFNTAVGELKEQFAKFEKATYDPANAAVVDDKLPVEKVNLTRSSMEVLFSNFSPFFCCLISYVVAFVLCAASWIAWPKALGRSATAIIVATFLVHTLAIVARVYLSGRAPVTNLYSSAVFIGWAIVLAGLVIEAIFRLGFGSLIASSFGIITLQIATQLGLDGDTMAVLQAVLDTNFWLWTHVLCITKGYVATFVAGGIGIIYLVGGHVGGQFSANDERVLVRVMYGTLCFALFFSFVGTVLGGLWGDNSWGRFWGWDPKENGALIIVLWNALILHARWGKMAGPAGLAALAIIGNMWTTWSWFGVNEMGVGLHAYGGVEGEVSVGLRTLQVVVFSHPWIAALALIPRDTWRALFGAPSAPSKVPTV